MSDHLIVPAPSAARPYIAWGRLSEILASGSRVASLVVSALQRKCVQPLLWFVNQFYLPRLPAFRQLQQMLQSLLDHKSKSARHTSKKGGKGGSRKRHKKVKKPLPLECAWLYLEMTDHGENTLPSAPLVKWRVMAEHVDRVDYSMDTSDLRHSHISLTYCIRDPQTGDRRFVEHYVGLATNAGKWWFVDADRCCELLCLPPGGDRFRHPEAHGVAPDFNGTERKEKPQRPETSGVAQPRANYKKPAWRRAACRVKKAVTGCIAFYKSKLWRTAIFFVRHNLRRTFAWSRTILLGIGKQANKPEEVGAI